MATEIEKRLISVDECIRMVERGIMAREERVELIHGELVRMSPIGPPHYASVNRATQAFIHACGNLAIVAIQGTIVLDRFTASEPDVALLRPRADFYGTRHAGPDDIFLLVEMADTSLAYDLNFKARLYAEAGIHEYWVANIPSEVLIIYSHPENDTYAQKREIGRGNTVAPDLLPECLIRVDDLLP